MRVIYLSSFDRSFKDLSPPRQNAINEALGSLLSFFQRRREPPKGLGLKKLKKEFWEIRVGISERILFKIEGDVLILVFAGTHDEIKRFLRSA